MLVLSFLFMKYTIIEIKTKIKKLIIIPKPPALQASVIGACETNTAANPPSAVNPIMPTLNIPA